MTLLYLLIGGVILYAGLGLRFNEYKYVHLEESHKELLNQNVTQQQRIKKLQQELQELKSSLQINPQTQKIEDLFVVSDQESKLYYAYEPWITRTRPELLQVLPEGTKFGNRNQGYGSKSGYLVVDKHKKIKYENIKSNRGCGSKSGRIHDDHTISSSSDSSSDCSSSSSSSGCD